ncbi:hypothetical protein [Vibrio sp. Hal054]|uniref:hypothetical protein n=1 Tax=Vibrio sp. Hal054 TaxID=3035158 RepID=UPI00301BFDC8
MTTITLELRQATQEFKSRINGYNHVINYVEPPFPIGSIESYKAQLDLANEYLAKHPELNNDDFNQVGMPLYVKKDMTQRLVREHLLSNPEALRNKKRKPNLSELLWDAYMVLDHGDHDERLEMLDKLEKHFDKFGRPTTRS